MKKKVCKKCGRPFITHKDNKEQKFCSRECWQAVFDIDPEEAGFNDFTENQHLTLDKSSRNTEAWENLSNAVVINAFDEAAECYHSYWIADTQKARSIAYDSLMTVVRQINMGCLSMYTTLATDELISCIPVFCADYVSGRIVLGYINKCIRLNKEIKKASGKIEEKRLSLIPSGIAYDADRVDSSPDDRTASVFADIDEQERLLKEIVSERDIISDIVISCISDEYVKEYARLVLKEGLTPSKAANIIGKPMTHLDDKMRELGIKQFAINKGMQSEVKRWCDDVVLSMEKK